MMIKKQRKVKAPSALLLMMEGRSVFEMGSYIASAPLFKHMAKGDGHPVLVLPGLS